MSNDVSGISAIVAYIEKSADPANRLCKETDWLKLLETAFCFGMA